MSPLVPSAPQVRARQTTGSLRSLVILGLACTLFVAVVYSVVTGV